MGQPGQAQNDGPLGCQDQTDGRIAPARDGARTNPRCVHFRLPSPRRRVLPLSSASRFISSSSPALSCLALMMLSKCRSYCTAIADVNRDVQKELHIAA